MLYTEIKHKIKEIKELTRLGLINPNWLRDLEVFEQFTFHRNNGQNKSNAFKDTGVDFNISWQSVKLIVKKMES